MFIKQILVYILKYKDNMIEDYEEKPVKQFIIIYYESLMKDAINREDYEMAAKYKKWIENLKESVK